VKKIGMAGAEVARYLGVTASCLNNVVTKEEIGPVGEMT